MLTTEKKLEVVLKIVKKTILGNLFNYYLLEEYKRTDNNQAYVTLIFEKTLFGSDWSSLIIIIDNISIKTKIHVRVVGGRAALISPKKNYARREKKILNAIKEELKSSH